MLVIPVPMHPAKQRQRGFNHAELLARAAMVEMRRRHPQWELHLETSLLKRVRVTVSQAGLTTHQRRQNLRGAFFAPHPDRLAGRDVLLIDDIYTTGATARACSRVLRNAGAAIGPGGDRCPCAARGRRFVGYRFSAKSSELRR